MTPVVQVFDTHAQASAALAGEVAAVLRDAVSRRGEASLAVPGGTTPAEFLGSLGEQSLDWPRVTVLLTDDTEVKRLNWQHRAKAKPTNVLYFPAHAPGNLTFYPDVGKWGWTTFNEHQWDLNWSNPQVFLEIVKIMLFLAVRALALLAAAAFLLVFLLHPPDWSSVPLPLIAGVIAALASEIVGRALFYAMYSRLGV